MLLRMKVSNKKEEFLILLVYDLELSWFAYLRYLINEEVLKFHIRRGHEQLLYVVISFEKFKGSDG